MEGTSEIKEQLVKHLHGGEAFMPVEEMLKEIPFDRLGEKPGNLPYSFYELFYHIWFAQKDILDYCKANYHQENDWSGDYWPTSAQPDTEAKWKELQQAFFDNRKELIEFLRHPGNNLLQPVRPGTDHTLLREILLVIEHNAYHTGQLLVVLRNLGLHS